MGSILIVDDDDDLRACLEDLFSLLGQECRSARSVKALQALGQSALDCDLAVLDVNLGANEPSGIDAYHWLMSSAFGGRVVFLTGHTLSYSLAARAAALGVPVYQKPIELDTLSAMVPRGN